VLSLCSYAANAVILLSDRAPGVFRRVGTRIDAGVSRAAGATGVDVPARVPQSDFDVHIVIWGLAALLVGLAVWSWLSLLLASAAVFASSVGFELSQRVLTQSRTVQLADVVGNAVGVSLGTAAAVTFALAWWAVSTRRS